MWLASCCTHPQDLTGPLLEVQVQTQGGTCTQSVAVDAENGVWSRASCEGDSCYQRAGSIDAATRADLLARIDAVSSEALAPGTVCPSASPYDRFTFLAPSTPFLGQNYCRASASAEAIAIVDQLLALASRP